MRLIERSNAPVIVAATILLVSWAWGGPTRPSKDSSAPARAPAIEPPVPPAGTITLPSANPAPGADLTVSPAGKAPSLTMVFSVPFDKVLADAFLDLIVAGARGKSCGS